MAVKASRVSFAGQSLPTSLSTELFALFLRPNILPSKASTWGSAPRRHLRLCLGPGSAEIKAKPRKHQPHRARESQRARARGARGPGPGQAQGSQRGLPPTGWSLNPLPPARWLSLGVIKSEILLLVTPVLPARADLHMKGLRRAPAFSFSHSQ